MLIKKLADIRPSEITDRGVYRQRREFLRAAGIAAASLFLPVAADAGQQLTGVRKGAFRVDEKLTDYKHATSYNNFYEFGTDKSDPAKNSKNFRSAPWTVTVDGEVKRPARYQIEDLLKHHPLEERVYRLRCVEAWSMVVPWVGFPLADLVKRVEPTSRAKYVEFTTLHDPADAGPAAGSARRRPRLAVPRGPAAGRGPAPANAARGRALRRGAAEPERRADPVGGAVEVRLQEHQVRRTHPFRRATAGDHLGEIGPARIWVFTPMSIQPWIIRAGARPPSGASARIPCFRPSARRCRSTVMPSRWRRFTPAWI